ncbi:MAG: helicase-associated domain-containing protein [Actinomycetota bacterium]|nr:helicase-associated domain-containing protein [Actinomycetota bacterium]
MAKKRRTTSPPTTLSAALRELGAGDMAELLRGRPEAGAVAASAPSPDYAALAAALASPGGIRRAIVDLDELRLQLLIVATWFGPTVTVDRLREQAPEVSDADLAKAARGLSLLGLAFKAGGRRSWSLWIPACVGQVVEELGDPGPRIRLFLELFTVDELVGVAHKLDTRWTQRPHKRAMVEGLEAVLSDARGLASLIEGAPHSARRALELIRREGRQSATLLIEAGVADWSDFSSAYSFTPHPRRQSGVAWLRERALALPETDNRWQSVGGYFVPGEVEVALRGGTVYRRWRPHPPEHKMLEPSVRPEHGPDQAVSDVEGLLEEWSSAPAVSLKAGGLGVRALRKAAQLTGIDERRVVFFYALMVEAGLLCEDGDTITSSPRAADWLQQAPAAKWSALLEAWPQMLLWSDQEGGLVPLSSSSYYDFAPLRRAVLQVLGAVPEGHSLDQAALGDSLAWARSQLFHCGDCAGKLASKTVEALVMLGTACSSPNFELLEPARTALVDPDWAADSNPASKLFPAPVAECTIQADLTVIVPGPPTPELGAGLARFADIRTSSPARIYRISEVSVTRALDLRMSAEEMISLLERHAPRGIPQSVSYLIEDVARRHGRVRVGEGGVYIRADDPELLTAVLAERRVDKLNPRRLAPTVAVVQGVSESGLLKTLRDAGHKPVPEEGGSQVQGPARRTPRPILSVAPAPSELSEDDARRLAEALLGGRGGPASGRAEPSESAPDRASNPAIVELLQQAERCGVMVELAYRTSEGVRVQRVDPIMVNPLTVAAWVVDEQKTRMFETDRIEWAQPLCEQEDGEIHELG